MTFYGNTTFLQNKGRYGGAVYAKHAEINFQGSVTFLENRGEYGGSLMLHQFGTVSSTEHSIFVTRDKDRLPALL